jgi:hypothetical protein
MEPINYILDVKNPIEEAIKGYTMGRNDIAQRQDMQIQQQNAAMQQQAFADQQTALAEQRAAAAQQQAQAAAYQQDLMLLRDAAANGTLTTEMQNAFNLKYAANQAEIKTAFDAMSEPKRAEQTAFGINLVTSLLSGNADSALTMLDERILAAENSGDTEEAAKLRANRKVIEMDPYAAAISIGSAMTAADAIKPDVWKSILDATQPKAAEAASPLGKISQDVKAGLIPQSILDSAITVDKQSAEGGLTPKDKAAQEQQIRQEWTKLSTNVSEARRNQNLIETSANDDSGAGDIALVTAFSKMLDPMTGVRDTEFANARDSGGLYGKLLALTTQVQNGKFLSPEQRESYKRLSAQYLKAAEDQIAPVRSSYDLLIENYGLNPENIYVMGNASTAGAGATPIPDAKAAFLADPRIKALDPAQQETAWTKYQELTAGQ